MWLTAHISEESDCKIRHARKIARNGNKPSMSYSPIGFTFIPKIMCRLNAAIYNFLTLIFILCIVYLHIIRVKYMNIHNAKCML